MKLSHLFAALGAALALSSAANAAILTSSTGSSANTVTSYSTPGLVAFDLDLQNFSGARLDFVIEEEDLLGPLGMNALVRNLSGEGLGRFAFQLGGIAFSAAGSVTPSFGTVSNVQYSSQAAVIAFAKPEFAEFQFGNPFGLNGKTDWFFDTTGLRAGDTFSITASVPEPSSQMLLLAALAVFGVAAAQRRKQG